VLTYIARRVLYSIPVLFVSTFLSFVFVSLAGNPTAALRANPRFSANTLHNIYLQNHLNKSIPVRYVYWLQDVFTHKLGKSLLTFQPIWPDITRTLGHTAQVIIIAEGLAILLGITVGIFSAIRQYSLFDYSLTAGSFVAIAIPVFWLGLILQILFVNIFNKWGIRIFYTSGLDNVDPGHGIHFVIQRAQHLGDLLARVGAGLLVKRGERARGIVLRIGESSGAPDEADKKRNAEPHPHSSPALQRDPPKSHATPPSMESLRSSSVRPRTAEP